MKKNLIETTPSGQQEVIPGKEPLKKDPKKKKLKDRWDDLKKALDNKKAILDLAALQEDDETPEEDDQPDQDPGQQEADIPEGNEPAAPPIPGEEDGDDEETPP